MSVSEPFVSLIIPCYNLGEFVKEAVDSALAQTYSHIEVILVEDGSTDQETLRVVDSLKAENLTVHKTENQGLPAARNFGIDLAKGELIACLDADDVYEPDFAKECVAAFAEADQGLGIVTTWVQRFGVENQLWKPPQFSPSRLVQENCLHVASMFRKEGWRSVGGYNTNLSGYQDWDFWLSLVAQGYQWACVEKPLFRYRTREGSMIATSDAKRESLSKAIRNRHKEFIVSILEDVLWDFDRGVSALNHRNLELTAYIKELEGKYDVLRAESQELIQTLEVLHAERRHFDDKSVFSRLKTILANSITRN